MSLSRVGVALGGAVAVVLGGSVAAAATTGAAPTPAK